MSKKKVPSTLGDFRGPSTRGGRGGWEADGRFAEHFHKSFPQPQGLINSLNESIANSNSALFGSGARRLPPAA